MNQTLISIYNGVTDRKGGKQELQGIIAMIGSNNALRHKITSLRRNFEALKNESNAEKQKDYQETYEALKKSLPAVTWCGVFKQRKADALTDYSSLICLDIDNLDAETLPAVKEKIKGNEYTFLVFTSPSGNGLKVVVKVAGDADEHLANFLALQKYFEYHFSVKIDPSGKDVSRLCFLSHDPGFYCEYNSKVFDVIDPATIVPKQVSTTPAASPPGVDVKNLTRSQQKQLRETTNTLDAVKAFTDQLYTYEWGVEGKRNHYIFVFSCNANRKGFNIDETFAYVSTFATDLDSREVAATVKSAFQHNTTEHGKYASPTHRPSGNQRPRNDKTVGQGKDNRTAGNDSEHGIQQHGRNKATSAADEAPKFWNVQKDEEGRIKGYSMYYTGLLEFLEHGGYFRLPMGNRTFELIHYSSNICETVQPIHMKDYVIDWCKESGERQVLEMLHKGGERYFNMNKLNGLSYKRLEFIKDVPNEANFFFRNCRVRVTSERIEALPYHAGIKTLWRTSIIDRDFSIAELSMPVDKSGWFDLDKFNCEMAKFIALVAHNPKKKDVPPLVAFDRFKSICSAIGYMLHGWKSKVGKAVIAIDHKLPEDKSEQNGGTGKSIIGESFRYLKSTAIIDGRDFKEDYPFRFETIGVDTNIVVMQDCKPTLDFASFFVPITGDFTYNRRHTGYVTIKQEESPKWWFDTNGVFKGEGSSYRRRMHVIELDDYFNDEYTPLDEFGHYLFRDWDNEQFNLFFNFYFMCVQEYLTNGLVEYPSGNYENRRLLVECPQEFIDFLDAINEDPGPNRGKHRIQRNKEYKKKEIMTLWNQESKELNMTPASAHQFTKWTKKYCRTKHLTLYVRKSSGTEYWTLADANYDPAKKEVEEIPFPEPN
jgi:hypothetical protein